MKEVYPSAEGNLSLINYPEGMAGDGARPPDIISVLSMKQESSNIHDERTSGPGRQRQTTPFRLSRKFLVEKGQTLIFPEECEILTAFLEY